MSVLDDIKEQGENANHSLDEAKALVQRADTEAEELESSASSHGWSGVAGAMSSARQSLEGVIGAIDDASDAVGDGLRELGEITDEMSSDEVARRLGEISGILDGAKAAIGRAQSGVDEAKASAQGADAATVSQLLEDAEEPLGTATSAANAAITSADAERSDATTWGS